ncbi:MAG: riboflavin biosynthesis protein RibF [Gammaproteobacteria bacterium]|nr:riboflavin biosynthesis protein RibF [Gammaproteobacteria bacterium]
MRLLRGRVSPGAMPGGGVVAIGKFDALHLGHREVLARACSAAGKRQLPSVLLTFEPLPEEFFVGNDARARLTRFSSKWRLVEALGCVDTMACLRFDRALSRQPAEAFVLDTLVKGLGARAVFVGEDFRFGHQRKGDAALLEEMGRQHGFEVTAVPAIGDAAGRISSSRVHHALAGNRLDEAAELLGRPYRLHGRVRPGDKRGAQIGFPTANLALGHRPPPLAGIYVVRAEGLPGGARHGMANVGTSPAVGGTRRLLEVHFPGFDGDLYGHLLAVDFLHWLRAEEKFGSRGELTEAIRADIEAGEGWLRAQGRRWSAG